MAIARVEPLTTARALRGPFDYRLGERFEGAGVGSVLRVPFGPQKLLGVVVEIAESSELPPERLAEPLEAVGQSVPEELVELGLWVAREYCSTPSRGLGLVLPPGTGRSGRSPRPALELRVTATQAATEALENGVRLGERQRAALTGLIEAQTELAMAQIAGGDVGRDVLRRLEARGLVALREVAIRRSPQLHSIGAAATAVDLTGDQERAVETIAAALDGDGPDRLLLNGVTGSGKTEVYMAAVEHCLARGRGAIVLVPEIAITPQTMGRFNSRFGDRVALLHSRLAAGERADEWRRLRQGEAVIAVGPRSAVFAPVADLGLIVIDEEHEASYKQEGDPRYDAREVAVQRARDAGAVLVAGTATPRPESWLGLARIELPERVDGRSLPEVEVLDMRAGGETAAAGSKRAIPHGPLHPRTREALQGLRRQGGKAIVLLNRRGWSPHLECRSCGRTWACPDCDVSLVLHRGGDALRCHHCGHSEAPPASCPECGSVTLARHGSGTERVSSLLEADLDPLPVFRLDSDSAAGSGGHAKILAAFQAADNGVLVGTQMVAKGHDFPEVVLAVVVDADATLRFPDFRAEERTFALVSQLAGRSGRGQAGGRVLVQTMAPDAAAIRAAADHDAAGFLEGELERRRALGYPPFAHLIRVELSSEKLAEAERAASVMAERLASALESDVGLLGPAPRMRLRGRNRFQLLVKTPRRGDTVDLVRSVVDDISAKRLLGGAALAVDVDPQ